MKMPIEAMPLLNKNKAMNKIFLILIAVVALEAIYSCNRENEPIDENATTRGTNVKDSTENSFITLNTEWVPDTTVNF